MSDQELSNEVRDRCESLASRLRGWLQLRALSLILGGLVTTLLVCATADWWLRQSHPAARWTMTLVWGISSLCVLWVAVRRYPRGLSGMAAAAALERHDPNAYGRQLVTAYSLAVEPLPRESAVLRRQVLENALAKLRSISLTQHLDRLAFLPEIVMALLAGGLATTLLVSTPELAGIAFARLIRPHQEVSWPTRHDLAFVDLPDLLAAGRPHTLSLIDRKGKPLRRVILDWQDADGKSGQVVAESSSDRVLIELPAQQVDVQVMAVADDSRTALRRIAILPAPRLVQNEWWIKPPECLGLATYPSPTPAVILADSQIQLVSQFDALLEQVELYSSSDEPIATAELTASSQGTQGRFAFLPASLFTQSLRMQWRDRRGLIAETRLEPLRLMPDEPPSVKLLDDEIQDEGVTILAAGGIWKLTIELTDNVPWQSLSLEATNPETAPWRVGQWQNRTDSPSSGLPTSNTRNRFDTELPIPKKSTNLSGELPEQGELFAIASDPCGKQGVSSRHRFRIVSPEIYVETWSRSWESWLDRLETWRRDLESLRRPESNSGTIDSAVFIAGIDRALIRLDGPSDSLLLALQRLETLAQRQGVTAWPSPARARLGLEALRKEISPLLHDIKSRRRARDSEMDASLRAARSNELDAVWTELFAALDRYFGPAARRTRRHWIERLERSLEKQKALRAETLERQVSGQPPTDQNAARQAILAAESEQMVAEALESSDSQSRWLSSLLASSGIAAAQRRAASSLDERRIGSALSAQDEAISSMERVLLELRTHTPDESHSETPQGELSRILGRILAERQMLEAWMAIDPELQEESRRDRTAQDWEAMAEHLRQRATSEGMESAQARLESASKSLAEAAAALRAGEATTAQQRLDEAVGQLNSAIDDDSESPVDGNNARSSSTSFTLPKELPLWIETQRGIVSRMESGPPQTSARDVSQSASLWYRQLSQEEQRLSHAILAAITEERRQQQPLAVEALLEVIALLNGIAQTCETSADRIQETQPPEGLVALSREVVTRLEQLIESETRAITPDSPTLSETSSEDSTEDSSQQSPAELRGELVRLRDRQQKLLDSVLMLRRRTRPQQGLTPELREPLQQEQLRLQQLAEILESRWRTLTDTAVNQEDRPQTSELPGLEGLPGLPAETSPRVAPAGEDLGAEGSPFETILIAMQESVSRLTQGELGPPTEIAQRRVLSELDRMLGGTPPKPTPSSGSMASGTAGVEAGTTASTSPISETLLPESIWDPSGIWGRLPERVQRSLRQSGEVRWIEGFEDLSIEYFRAVQETLDQ